VRDLARSQESITVMSVVQRRVADARSTRIDMRERRGSSKPGTSPSLLAPDRRPAQAAPSDHLLKEDNIAGLALSLQLVAEIRFAPMSPSLGLRVGG